MEGKKREAIKAVGLLGLLYSLILIVLGFYSTFSSHQTTSFNHYILIILGVFAMSSASSAICFGAAPLQAT